MRPTPDGVGVKGGGLIGDSDIAVLRFLCNGVTGSDGTVSSASSEANVVSCADAEPLVLRFFAAGAALATLVYFAVSLTALASESLEALLLVTRVERRRDMMGCLLQLRKVVVGLRSV